jgi:beta-galactosidase
MPVARIFIVWDYVQVGPDRWDFSLYDAAFRSAEKYKVKIAATLTASDAPSFLNHFHTGTAAERKRISSDYLAKVVERYKGSVALDTWLLQNEPGAGTAVNPESIAAFQAVGPPALRHDRVT